MRGRNIFKKKVSGEALGIEVAADLWVTENGFGFRAKCKAPAGKCTVIQRLLAHPVPCQNQPFSSTVPDRQREHAIQAANELRSFLFIKVDQALGVA